ncbi:MAG: hypothetical protein A4E27_00547 [Methanobacterium sp. PtaU1.Bin242]|nr:MAG: hypothetical protein A4E27_00547 [Methanobacterium sp. PtaU1.Bin242]
MFVIPAETLLVAAGLGAFLQVWQMDGFKLGIFFEDGVLQIGVIMSFVTGIGGALLALRTGLIPLTGDMITDLLVVFFMAFMIPFAIDRFITKSPIGNSTGTA